MFVEASKEYIGVAGAGALATEYLPVAGCFMIRHLNPARLWHQRKEIYNLH